MKKSPQKENGYTAIANEIMEALAKIRIPGEARQMLDVIIRKTYGYQKKEDSIATSQFMQLTGLPNFSIHRARKRLLLAKLITVCKNANSQILSYSFQKDYSIWTTVCKNAQCAKTITNCMQKSAFTVTNNAIHKRNYTKEIKKGIFIPPTIEEVKNYCKEANLTIQTERFVDFYQAKDWMIGKNKMKDWRAAVRNWARSNPQKENVRYE